MLGKKDQFHIPGIQAYTMKWICIICYLIYYHRQISQSARLFKWGSYWYTFDVYFELWAL